MRFARAKLDEGFRGEYLQKREDRVNESPFFVPCKGVDTDKPCDSGKHCFKGDVSRGLAPRS